MKTYRQLYPQVYDFENLYASYRAARRAKRGRVEVARFEARVEDELFRLQDELRNETYRPGTYRNFYIYEPKKRKISAAPFPNFVAHRRLKRPVMVPFQRRLRMLQGECTTASTESTERCGGFYQGSVFSVPSVVNHSCSLPYLMDCLHDRTVNSCQRRRHCSSQLVPRSRHVPTIP